MSSSLSPQQRSALMARITRNNTKPELRVRGLLHGLGYRFRIQLSNVPGRPDIAFPRRKKAIFVNGCFWHAHDGCRLFKLPKTRTEFWSQKFAANRERDTRLLAAARSQGWDCIVLWECEILSGSNLSERLVTFLGPTRFLAKADRS